MCGVASSQGTIEAGKVANIIAINGDPIANTAKNIENVAFVMKRGAITAPARAPAVDGTPRIRPPGGTDAEGTAAPIEYLLRSKLR